jgi:predicted unusual protein kinase regulating ubiquinone biosynthesis (AarF/ABC1/UbiB family)
VQYPGLATAVAADLLTLRALAAAALALSSPGAVPDLAWLVAQLRRNLVRFHVVHVWRLFERFRNAHRSC